ncbi:MAG: hypothetical protein LAQ30_13825, partial [Acidobacteriia bacterium]|nr:hypothetical protein [Terriglobia bacterium]
SAVGRLPEKELTAVMEGYFGGAALRIVEKGAGGPVRELRSQVFPCYWPWRPWRPVWSLPAGPPPSTPVEALRGE